MSALNAFVVSILIVVSAKTLAWLMQLRTRNAGLVDAIWGWTLGGLAVFYAAVGSAPIGTRVLLGLMGGLWGLRLGTHLWRRNYGKPEDFRYSEFRQKWGKRANFNMFWFFQFQNIFTLMLSASAFIAVAYRPDAPNLLAMAAAILLWLISVIGEAVADNQMETFRGNPANKGRVCRDGFWGYSRHPNYFFECVHWLAYVPLALCAPWGWASLIAPALMAWMLVKLSGMPMLEADMAKRKPGYADYMRSTSALIPWPPKS